MTEPCLPDPLVVTDAAAWQSWLLEHAGASDGVWLALAKKGTVEPTSLSYQQALEEALCHGWIDGQRRSRDERLFLQRFTPRRARSIWSQRNVDLVVRLAGEGRLHPRGLAEVDRAKADGRWERAYAGQASVQIPAALAEALAENPLALQCFDALGKAERYTALHPIISAPNQAVQARRIARLLDRLGR